MQFQKCRSYRLSRFTYMADYYPYSLVEKGKYNLFQTLPNKIRRQLNGIATLNDMTYFREKEQIEVAKSLQFEIHRYFQYDIVSYTSSMA